WLWNILRIVPVNACQSAWSSYILISCSIIPFSFSTDASEKYGSCTKSRSISTFSFTNFVVENKYAVLVNDVYALGDAPFFKKSAKTSRSSFQIIYVLKSVQSHLEQLFLLFYQSG